MTKTLQRIEFGLLFASAAALTFVVIQRPAVWASVLIIWLSGTALFTAFMSVRGRRKDEAKAHYARAFRSVGADLAMREAELKERAERRKTEAHVLRQRDLYAFAKEGAPPATFGKRKSVPLNASQLTRLNVQRRLTGRPMLNEAGFARAIAVAPAHDIPADYNSWLLYLLMFHAQTHCDADRHYQGWSTIKGDVSILPVGGGYGGVWTGIDADPSKVITPEPAAAAALKAGAETGFYTTDSPTLSASDTYTIDCSTVDANCGSV